MFKRFLDLPDPGTETFFLWGPRQTGKSTLLRQRYPDARWVDLLKGEEFRRYLDHPEYLRQELESAPPAPGRQIVIDEVQKVPALLDEVHWLIENRGLHFALCGSSARKVRRGAANLLGGRAVRYELHGLTAGELGDDFDLERMLNHGYLPRMYQAQSVRGACSTPTSPTTCARRSLPRDWSVTCPLSQASWTPRRSATESS